MHLFVFPHPSPSLLLSSSCSSEQPCSSSHLPLHPSQRAIHLRQVLHLAEALAQQAQRPERSYAGRPHLDRVFVMTNGAPEWVALLKQALAATGHYKHVASSRDLVLSWEQKYVAQAVDMLVGQRAQVFIGNGVRARPSSVSGSRSN